ncbi:MAG TPA: (Fe-S)-binding protein [Syntrophales bacterium]|nr:(Fe-S)-binding protein [Syntrophales bacterium]HPQ45020.1 (Fe-S)-binding protein [Syntrophales bacterium]
MIEKSIPISDVLNLPLDIHEQEKAVEENIPSVKEGRLKTYSPDGENVKKLLSLLKTRLTRQVVGSMVGCVHCGMCTDSCHYALARPDDPTMAPAYKADQIRRIFKKHFDWTGRIVPWWVHADDPKDDEDLNRLKNIVFGTCTGCRRCTFNCPMGVDTATLVRLTRGLLSELGIVPEGVFQVSRDQWETGNQMAVSEQDYIDTIEWMEEESQDELEDPSLRIPIDKEDCDFMYTVNPREIKYDPRSLGAAAKIFHLAGESWTMPKWGWDMTNFGLFSGDDKLGGFVARNLYEAAKRLRAKRIVISECGHGYRSSRWEGYNWGKYKQDIPSESVLITLIRYINEGRIKVDPSKNSLPITFHDSCNIARSGDLTEEPRWLLQRLCTDFREMHPNRADNFCCTGGGGALSMVEYKPLRMEVAKIKADQLAATGAKIVCTICHNCIDGLTDVIKHYQLDMKVVQILELVENALVLPKK